MPRKAEHLLIFKPADLLHVRAAADNYFSPTLDAGLDSEQGSH